MRIRTATRIGDASLAAIVLCVFAPARARAGERPARAGALTLGEWHCIGPFKDEEFGNVRRTLEFAFEPETDALAAIAAGRGPDLARAYRMKAFPGYLDLRRRWRRRDEWTDGYRNLLPRGPAPSSRRTPITATLPRSVRAWPISTPGGSPAS